MTEPERDQWFPKTKFTPPKPTRHNLQRPRLLDILSQELLTHALTVISAPAGSGKTTLAAQFIQQAAGVPWAWLRLDGNDNEPATFLAALLLAVQQAVPSIGEVAFHLLQRLPAAQLHGEQILGLFINDLAAADFDKLVIVLDDYHHVKNPEVHALCEYLLENMPAALHLLIMSRIDPPLPLARLRMRGQLAELHLAELRFNREEMTTFLRHQWQIELSPADLQKLEQHTEGWIASLQLLALALRRLASPEQQTAFIARFSRSNRLVFQLMAKEVLAEQPPELQAFLLQTAVLTELTPALCAAVTNNPHASSLLADAYQRRLFLTAVNDEMSMDTAYRYHDLFAAFLQQQLALTYPQRLPELHLRAAMAHPDPGEKVHHFLAAGRVEDAAAVLEKLGRRELQLRYIRRKTYDDICLLPRETLNHHPWLLLTLGAYHAQRGQITAAAPWFDQAEAYLQTNSNPEAEIELLLGRAWMVGSPSQEMLATIQEMLTVTPHLFTPEQKATFHSTAMWHYMMHFDWVQVTRHVLAGIDLVLHSGNEGAATMFIQAFGPDLLFNDRGLAAFEPLIQAQDGLPGVDSWPMQLNLHLMRGWLAYFRAQHDEAEAAFLAGRHLLQFGSNGWTDGHLACLELSLLRWRGEYGRLLTRSKEIMTQLKAGNVAGVFAELIPYFQGQAALLQQRPQDAVLVYEQLRSLQSKFFGLYVDTMVALLGGQIALANGRLAEAETLLIEAANLHRQTRSAIWYPHPRLALARLRLAQGVPQQALLELQDVLADVERFQMPGLLLMEGPPLEPLLRLAAEHGLRPEVITPVLALLAQATEPRATAVPQSNETISPREMEVLHLLAQGASNRAIATALVITERTAKAHVSSILGKLGVNKRGEAVARARELGLI